MSNISSSNHANLILKPGEIYRVSTGGVATVTAAYGAPAGVTTVTASTQDFGPYTANAKLRVDAVTGTASYRLLDAAGDGDAVPVTASRALTPADDGKTLECTTTVTLTVPAGLNSGFGCAVIPSGTTSIARSGGALLNGAGTTLTRTAAANTMFAIVARASVADSYVVTGA